MGNLRNLIPPGFSRSSWGYAVGADGPGCLPLPVRPGQLASFLPIPRLSRPNTRIPHSSPQERQKSGGARPCPSWTSAHRRRICLGNRDSARLGRSVPGPCSCCLADRLRLLFARTGATFPCSSMPCCSAPGSAQRGRPQQSCTAGLLVTVSNPCCSWCPSSCRLLRSYRGFRPSAILP